VQQPDLLSALPRKITYVTGKGGVGKTTIAAALAIRDRALLAELGGDGQLGRLLQGPVEHIPQLMHGVFAANFSLQEGLVATLKSFVPVERVVRAVVTNRVLQMFIETAPSVREAVLLDALGRASSQYHRVYVDLPASGHALTLLNTPTMITKLVKRGPIAKKADDLRAQILSPEAAQILLVALPEALPVQETIELAEKLRGDVPIAGVVLNQVLAWHLDSAERKELEQIAGASGHALSAQAVYLLQATEREDASANTLAAETGLAVWRIPQVGAGATPLQIATRLLSH